MYTYLCPFACVYAIVQMYTRLHVYACACACPSMHTHVLFSLSDLSSDAYIPHFLSIIINFLVNLIEILTIPDTIIGDIYRKK